MAADTRAMRSIAQLSDPDETARRKAADRLGRPDNIIAVEPLCAALDDANWRVRRAAARSLGVIGDARAVEPLCRALHDKSRGARRKAIQSLGQLRAVAAVEPICRLLTERRNAGHDSIRSDCADALTAIGIPAVPALCRLLTSGKTHPAKVGRTALLRIYQGNDPRDTLHFGILAGNGLTPQQRLAGLETLRGVRCGWELRPRLTHISHYCEEIVAEAGKRSLPPEVVAGAQAVLESLTLVRGSQADGGSGRDSLLRAASHAVTPQAAASLLRASAASGSLAPTAPRAGFWQRLYGSILRLLRRSRE